MLSLLKILNFFYKYLKKVILGNKNQNNDPYLSNYQGHDKYNNQWLIAIDNDKHMQLWAITRKGLICNCGYYAPYRNLITIKTITRWNSSCRKN